MQKISSLQINAYMHVLIYGRILGGQSYRSNRFRQWNANFLSNPEVSECVSTLFCGHMHKESLHMI